MTPHIHYGTFIWNIGHVFMMLPGTASNEINAANNNPASQRSRAIARTTRPSQNARQSPVTACRACAMGTY